MAVGAPATPASPARSDFEGKVDCEKGVVGEVMLANVLAEPSIVVDNAAESCASGCSEVSVVEGKFWAAEMAMYVSIHLAGRRWTQALARSQPKGPNEIQAM